MASGGSNFRRNDIICNSHFSKLTLDNSYSTAFAPFVFSGSVVDPSIAVAVLLENGGGGSENAAPVARAIIDAYLMDIEPSLQAADPSSLLQAAR